MNRSHRARSIGIVFFRKEKMLAALRASKKEFFSPIFLYQSIGLGENCSFPASKRAAGENFFFLDPKNILYKVCPKGSEGGLRGVMFGHFLPQYDPTRVHLHPISLV